MAIRLLELHRKVDCKMRVVWLFLLLCVAAAKTGSRQRQKHLQAQVRGSHKANANAEAQIAAAVNALLEETDQLSILVASDAELRHVNNCVI